MDGCSSHESGSAVLSGFIIDQWLEESHVDRMPIGRTWLEGRIATASDLLSHSCVARLFRRICACRMWVPASAAKRVNGASFNMLRTTMTPESTRRLAICERNFPNIVRAECNKSSNCSRIEWSQQGPMRETNWSLGPHRQVLRRTKVSWAASITLIISAL